MREIDVILLPTRVVDGNKVEKTCGNCVFCKEIQEWHYTNRGCTHSKPPGYACLGCADEGVVIHMTGTNRDIERCEMWRGKNE